VAWPDLPVPSNIRHFLASREGFGHRERHVKVVQTVDSARTGERAVVEAEQVERSQAFLGLADRHLDAAYRLANAILRNPAEAEDATQDAIVQAWQKWPSLRDPTLFEHWFDRILVNNCRSRLRSDSRMRTRDISAEIAIASGDAFAASNDRELIGRAIGSLSPEHRIVVALRYYRDLSIDEIAGYLGVPAGTVQSRLHYALKRLHATLDAADAKETLR
jgi:RNA polymerase sigma-70 factor, ECF subfamily